MKNLQGRLKNLTYHDWSCSFLQRYDGALDLVRARIRANSLMSDMRADQFCAVFASHSAQLIPGLSVSFICLPPPFVCKTLSKCRALLWTPPAPAFWVARWTCPQLPLPRWWRRMLTWRKPLAWALSLPRPCVEHMKSWQIQQPVKMILCVFSYVAVVVRKSTIRVSLCRWGRACIIAETTEAATWNRRSSTPWTTRSQ